MKNFMILSAVSIVALLSCRGGLDDDVEDMSFGDDLSHEMIVLGKQLEDPYSVKNITKAIENLYPTKASTVSIVPTDMYVRFLPQTEHQLDAVMSLGLTLMDHPLDYQIIRDGDYYHDPLISDDRITWLYAVVPTDFSFPEGVRHEILDECYIPSEMTRSASGLDWDEVEREAYRLTGNADMIGIQTKAKNGVTPKGRITIVDQDANNGKPFGVAGVTVVCNSFVKFSSTTTDRDGYYEMKKNFATDVRYRLMFKNKQGFAIGFNLLLVPASSSALGKSTPDGVDFTITSKSDRKLFTRACVNNAVYEYNQKCGVDNLNITAPPSDLRMWLFQNLKVSSSPMLRHGTMLDQGVLKEYLGDYAPILEVFLPDITLGLKGMESYSDIYARTCHELAHASHYQSVGNAYWDAYMTYVLKSFVKNVKEEYGDGKSEDSGYCEIGEMWAYFMQNLLFHDRYGGTMPSSGTSWWFHPQILRYLNERGLTVSQLFQALTADTKDLESLRKKLLALYPSNSSTINQIFTRYAE